MHTDGRPIAPTLTFTRSPPGAAQMAAVPGVSAWPVAEGGSAAIHRALTSLLRADATAARSQATSGSR